MSAEFSVHQSVMTGVGLQIRVYEPGKYLSRYLNRLLLLTTQAYFFN